MSAINTKVVHITNRLLGLPYGENFIYDEMRSTGPGEEPDKAAREAGYYSIAFYGIDNGEVVGKITIADDCDPGCGSTCKLVGESAMCLLRDDITVSGGFWTPVSAMGDKLHARLFATKTVTISENF